MRIYLTSAAALAAVRGGRAKGDNVIASVGPGPAYSIMRRPPEWVTRSSHARDGSPLVAGQVLSLTPPTRLLDAALAGRRGTGGISWGMYAALLRTSVWRRERLGPGVLSWGMEWPAGAGSYAWDGAYWRLAGEVVDGATLVCTCGIGDRCHRRVAAELLHGLGWLVTLDGETYTDAIRAAHAADEVADAAGGGGAR